MEGSAAQPLGRALHRAGMGTQEHIMCLGRLGRLGDADEKEVTKTCSR